MSKENIRIETENIKKLNATVYTSQEEKSQEFIDAMEKGDGKSVIWEILKQVRPGMSLDRITMPTHVMEPRSLLEKLTDFFTHLEILNEAANEKTSEERLKKLIKMFLSGFYITPAAAKKPYNPLWAEFHRTMWNHPDGSRTFFIAEQTSHHPPVSSFYCCNRQAGWVCKGNLDFITSFNGISANAGIRGELYVKFLKYDEEYTWNMPMCVCTGIYIPPLTMEYSGKLDFKCPQSKYTASIEMKTMSMWSAANYRQIAGTITDANNNVIYNLFGRYDQEVYIVDLRTNKKEVFFNVEELKKNRTQRLVREFDKLHPFESEKLFKRVNDAIVSNNQNLAMDEKFELEESQRKERRYKAENNLTQEIHLFDYIGPHNYKYKWENWDKYDEENEGEVIEVGGKIVTLKKNEELTEERVQEILKDIAYPEWKEDEEPPHMMKSFKFLLDRYKNNEKKEEQEEEIKEEK